MQRYALDLQHMRNDIARGAGLRCDDGEFSPSQGVEQRAFARIGLPGNHHPDTFPQQTALSTSRL